jgi:hypothetical protein
MITWLNSDERGASAVLVAASLFLLMGFAALTVDWGSAVNQRRQNQSAGDFGALAAVQFGNIPSPATAICSDPSFSVEQEAACEATLEVVDIVNANLGMSLTLADWAACTDSNPPSEFVPGPPDRGIISPLSDCVRFNQNLQKSRVVIPTIEVETTFGQVMGRAFIATSAFAEAQGDSGDVGKILPYGIPDSAGSLDEVCLKTGPHPDATGPCGGPISGNFGSIDILTYGNLTLGTPLGDCGITSTQAQITSNIILGVDHPLDEWSSGPGAAGSYENPNEHPEATRNEVAMCPLFTARPNQFDAQPGNNKNALSNGMYDGATVYGVPREGRLVDTPNAVVQLVSGDDPIDDRPLWSYLNGTGPGACTGLHDSHGYQSCGRNSHPADPSRATSRGSALSTLKPRTSSVPQRHATSNTAPGNRRSVMVVARRQVTKIWKQSQHLYYRTRCCLPRSEKLGLVAATRSASHSPGS